MVKFGVYLNPVVKFGHGVADNIPALAGAPGSKVLFVLSRSFSKSGDWNRIAEETGKREITVFEKTVHGEPSPESIDALTEEFRGSDIDTVIAIGGGSPLDTGKAVAAMLTVDGSVKDYIEGLGSLKHPGTSLPFIAVPTTAGTGSEATKNAVISSPGPEGFKKSLRHDNFVPSAAVVDPNLTINLPNTVRMACAMDAFSQLIEAYLSKKASPYTDCLALSGIGYAAGAISRMEQGAEPNDEDRAALSYAAYLSGVALANAGLGTVHGIAGPVGGYCDMPHGEACGILLEPVMRKIAERLASVQLKEEEQHDRFVLKTPAEKLKAISKAATGHENIGALLDMLSRWSEAFDLPKFSDYNLTENDLEAIARKSGNKNSPVECTETEILSILKEKL